MNDTRTFACDFETTVFKGQTFTEVWAAACVELGTEDVFIFHSINEFFDFFKTLKCTVNLYFHNLKFDGAFILSYLMTVLKLKQAFVYTNEEETAGYWIDNKEMNNNTFKYTISDMGMWYTIDIKIGGCLIHIKDSLKLLPFSLREIGTAFKTKHQKLEMEYEGYRYAGCVITDEEKQYIANDVLVLKEALEIMFEQGHTKLTIGSCCLQEFKKMFHGQKEYYNMFPDLTKIPIDKNIYGSENADAYIRKSYKGGWCYVVKGKENQRKRNGLTADVNSLYPSVMSSESGSKYPWGKPVFWKGNEIPEEAMKENRYYFVRIKTRFYLKKNYLPFIQIKNSYRFKANECLETSDYINENGERFTHYKKKDGTIQDTRVILTLTMTDFKLLKDHYNLVDFEILDGCYFRSASGLFDEYIEKYKQLKVISKGALRTLAKLFLNNLYGKLASSTDSSFKIAYVKEDGSIGFKAIPANDKDAGYIACGSAITSYARNFTIRTAQQNYYGVDEPGFIYADTDSIHCDLPAEALKGVTVHDKNFCCWKLETYWDEAIFARQKTYIEHVTHEDMEQIEEPYYNVKCAGMPDKCKKLFVMSLECKYDSMSDDEKLKFTDEEIDFISTNRNLDDFKVGLKVPGKLMPKRIPGGVLLVETTYEMR